MTVRVSPPAMRAFYDAPLRQARFESVLVPRLNLLTGLEYGSRVIIIGRNVGGVKSCRYQPGSWVTLHPVEELEKEGLGRAGVWPANPLRYHFSTAASYLLGKWFRTWPKRQAPD